MVRRNYDNVSIAHTRSSKTIKNKLSKVQQYVARPFQRPYFQQDELRNLIQQRGDQYLKKKQKKQNDHLDKASQIIKDLMARNKMAQEKLAVLKQQNQQRIKKQCPFQPQKKKIDKVVINNSFLRRNDAWLQQKKRKSMIRRQQFILQDLTKCTFKPQIKTPTKFPIKQSQSVFVRLCRTPQPQSHSTLSPPATTKRQKDITYYDYQYAKRQINAKLRVPIK